MSKWNNHWVGGIVLLLAILLTAACTNSLATPLPSGTSAIATVTPAIATHGLTAPTATPAIATHSPTAPTATATLDPQTQFIRYDERPAWQAFLGWPEDCEEGFGRFKRDPGEAGGIELYPAADGQYLAFVTCNLGPYWVEERLYWLDYRAGPPSAHPIYVPVLLQEDDPARGLQEVDTLTGAFPVYHPETQTLTNLNAYRGLKDCGVFYKYHLAGERFVLDEARYRDCEQTAGNPLDYETWSLVYPLASGNEAAVAFHKVAALPADLSGAITRLEALPNGALRLMTTNGYAVFQDGAWQSYFLAPTQRFIGVDDAGRSWFYPEEVPTTIFYWDSALADYGGSAFVHADAGWLPPSNPASLEGRGVLSEAHDQVWLATGQDVRVYADGRWTIFTRTTLDMPPALTDDLLMELHIHFVEERQQIWVGECDWAEGPMGGGGARWLDTSDFAAGQVYWRGGMTGTGCVTAITSNQNGNVWLGMANGLVRQFDQGTRQFNDFVIPNSGEYRQGYPLAMLPGPEGDLWVLSALCGGASCDAARGLYHLQDGVWQEVLGVNETLALTDAYPNLVFDNAGRLWFFQSGSAYRLEGNELLSVTDMDIEAATADSAGQIWIVAQGSRQEEPALWNFIEGE